MDANDLQLHGLKTAVPTTDKGDAADKGPPGESASPGRSERWGGSERQWQKASTAKLSHRNCSVWPAEGQAVCRGAQDVQHVQHQLPPFWVTYHSGHLLFWSLMLELVPAMCAGGSSPVSPPVHDFHTAVHAAGTAVSPRVTSEGFNLRNLSSGHNRRAREPAEAGGTELQAFDSGRYSLQCTQSVGWHASASLTCCPALLGKHCCTLHQSAVLCARHLEAEPDAVKGRSACPATACEQPGRPAGELAGRSAVPGACRYERCMQVPRHCCSLAVALEAQQVAAWHRSCQGGLVGPVVPFALVNAALTRAEPDLTLPQA